MAKTPSDKWRDTVGKYKIQCQQILKLSNNIRYSGVINSYGRTLTGTIKPNLKPLLNPEEVKNEFFIVSTLFQACLADECKEKCGLDCGALTKCEIHSVDTYFGSF